MGTDKNGFARIWEDFYEGVMGMEDRIRIRNMVIGDYDEVLALWRETPGMGLNGYDDSYDGIRDFLSHNPGTSFVAERDCGIVGVILCGHNARRGFIYHTAVAVSERMNGIGKALVDAANDALRDLGIAKVCLVAFADNDIGNAFWDRVGFTARPDLVYRDKKLLDTPSTLLWYHGSDKVFDTLNIGSTITQVKRLAVAFSHKPSFLCLEDDGTIIHNGMAYGYLYQIDEDIRIGEDVYEHPRTTIGNGMEYLTKRLLKVKLISEPGDVLPREHAPTRLETDRLILRSMEYSDLNNLHRMMSDKKAMYFLDDIATNDISGTYDNLKYAISNADGRYFGIEHKETGSYIGQVGYTITADTPLGKVVHLGYFILPEHHNNGYTTEAAKKALDYAFTQDNCVRVTTACYSDNVPSRRVMEKVGFRKEAEKIGAQYHDGVMKDRLEYAINRDEYR